MREELLKGLTEEQKNKVKECKSSEEILALAKAEGVTLTDEQLEAVSGGACIECIIKCPKCGSGNWNDEYKEINHIKYRKFKCNDCGHKWKEQTL
jgi:transposase-like protein